MRFGLLAVGCALLGFAGHWHWSLDLLSHFRWQYQAAMIAGLIGALVLRARPGQMVLLAGLVLNGWSLLGATGSGAQVQAQTVAQEEIKFLVANIHLDNRNLEPLLRLIDSEAPDVIGIVELSTLAAEALVPLDRHYPSHLRVPRDDPFGMAIWARQPDATLEALSDPETALPMLSLRAGPGDAWSFWLVHPFPPLGARGSEWRNRYLQRLALQIGTQGSAVVGGDFNATPWSAAYRDLRQRSGLADAAEARLPWPTWCPTGWVSCALGLPIDHLLHGADWQVAEFRIGPDIGSDHRPLIVSLQRRSSLP